MNWFTVLLLYPDYLNDGEQETYLSHVEALDVAEAIRLAQDEAAKENGLENGEAGDFACLCVFAGHQQDISGLAA